MEPTDDEQARAGSPEDAPPEQLRQDRDDLLARLQRVSADYLNYQKRVQRDADFARQYANEELVKSLLPVLDDMERALAAARENRPPDDPLLAGMQLVHDKAVETLGRFGVTVIEAEGKRFDPDLHHAVLHQPSEAVEPGMVLNEVQRGYKLKGRTIRPSTVVVSKAPGDEDENGAPAEEAEDADV
jgi:molecular chaperone GrpE